MITSIGIRREDRNQWERRIPLIPRDIKKFIDQDIRIEVQPSTIRCYKDEEFLDVGAKVKEDLSEADFLIGVKEMPISFIQPGKPHLFFSHTIKGQSYNMPLLKDILEKKATLIDYERIMDAKKRRLIAFGRFAGLAGAIDSLSILGKRWQKQGKITPLANVKFSHEYSDLENAKEELRIIGSQMQENFTETLRIAVPGYGNVSQGVQEILELFPLQRISAQDLKFGSYRMAYTVLKESDFILAPEGKEFDLQDYYQNPEGYRSCFHEFLPYLTAIISTIYWDERYPRLVTKKNLKILSEKKLTNLQVIGDISCDVEGAIECTLKTTDPGNPAFVYHPATEKAQDGIYGEGLAILAVDILPAEFSLDASKFFSRQLFPLLSQILQADFNTELSKAGLPDELKSAVIVWQGHLTEDYQYLEQFLTKSE